MIWLDSLIFLLKIFYYNIMIIAEISISVLLSKIQIPSHTGFNDIGESAHSQLLFFFLSASFVSIWFTCDDVRLLYNTSKGTRGLTVYWCTNWKMELYFDNRYEAKDLAIIYYRWLDAILIHFTSITYSNQFFQNKIKKSKSYHGTKPKKLLCLLSKFLSVVYL